nr:hypothetical protein [Tanacetum cinerariifolium]
WDQEKVQKKSTYDLMAATVEVEEEEEEEEAV